MPRSASFALALLLALPACGPSRPPPMAPPIDDEVDLDADGPRIAGVLLPRLPVDVTPEDPELAGGWARAEAVLRMPTPRPPSGEMWLVESWADEQLAGWMRRRAEAIRAAQRALDPARTGAPRYSVVASTILAILYTRFAMDVRGIPTPPAFAAEPGREREFRAALEQAAGPLWLRALDAYGSCSRVAGDQPAHTLARWREACDREIRAVSRMLPDGASEDDDDDA